MTPACGRSADGGPHAAAAAADGTPPLATLSPAYFGMVMATGIVSISAHMLDWTVIARALLALNVVAYVALAAWLAAFAGLGRDLAARLRARAAPR